MASRILRLAAAALLGTGLGNAAAAVDEVETEVALRLDPETRRLEADATLTVSAGGTAVLTLSDQFRVTRLTVDGAAGGDARGGIALGDAGRHEVRVSYEGVLAPADPERGPLGPENPAAGPEGSVLPPGDWWPTLDGAHGDFRLSIEAPAGQVATATGRRVMEQRSDDGYRVVFEGGPSQQPPAVFVGPYRVSERVAGPVTIRTYFHDEVAPLAGDYIDAAGHLIGRFETRIGRYPFDGFDIVSAPFPVGLGFAGATYVGRRVLPLPFMRGRSLAHEVLHNWWGNGVLVDYSSGNWCEGLTTYMADYALAEDEGKASAREMRLAWLRDFAALPPERDIPVTGFTARHHGAARVIGYNKVAMIFHMLRREVGPDRFENALRRFWSVQQGRRAGWAELRVAFEAVSGRPLERFFDQWLTRAGAPELSLAEVEAAGHGDAWRLSFRLSQAAPTYDLAVPVAVATDAGTVRLEVPLAKRSVRVRLPLAARPRWLAVDPDYHLFRHLAAGEAPPILRDVMLDASAEAMAAGQDPTVARLAQALAAGLLEVEDVELIGPNRSWPDGALILVGLTPEVDALLSDRGLGVPAPIRGRGSARAWVVRRDAGGPLMVVAAEDAAALGAVLGPLPHYGGRSYVVFDGARNIDRGVWDSPPEHALRRRLD